MLVRCHGLCGDIGNRRADVAAFWGEADKIRLGFHFWVWRQYWPIFEWSGPCIPLLS